MPSNMAHYTLVSRAPERPFSISGGLQEDWSSGKLHHFGEVLQAVSAWKRETGHIVRCQAQPTTLSYWWPNSGLSRPDQESGWLLSGSVGARSDADSDGDWKRISSLARFVASRLGQNQFSIAFEGQAVLYEQD